MGCPRCGAPLEGRFCTQCGLDTQPAYLCPVCGTPFSGWTCPTCGTPLGGVRDPPGSGIRSVVSLAWTIAIALFLLLAVLNLVALAYTSVLVVDGALAGGPRYIDLYVLAPYPVGERFDVLGPTFVIYFALVVGSILAAYLWYGFRDARSTGKAFARPLRELRGRLESRSAWVATGQVFLAATFFQVVYILVLAAGGVDVSAPDFSGTVPAWYPYYALANASVYEEFVARWMLIGVPLAASAVVLRRAAARPGAAPVPAWRHLFGGTVTRETAKPILGVAVVLAVLSSIVFGLAHVPSWGWWKFAPSALAGLGIAYLFLRHGLLAGILFHFSTNYLGAIALLTEDSLAAQILLGLFIFALIGFGALFFVWYILYASEVVRHVTGRPVARTPAPQPVAVGPPPMGPTWVPPQTAPAYGPPPNARVIEVPRYGGGFVAYRCGRCGWPEARYEGGRFTCLRCGHES